MVAVRTATVALVGNPNTGKTTLFNALAGMNQRVGNYPGVTVETKKGKLRHPYLAIDLIDLPGTYSLSARSPDEMLAVDVILGNNAAESRPDVVVTIVDASNLERNLYLWTQVLELGVPVIVALNMVDVAETQGLKIDVDKLSQQLGVPVVPIQANQGRGLDRLKSVIAKVLESPSCAQGPTFPDLFESEVTRLMEAADAREPAFMIRRVLLDAGGYAEQRLRQRYGPPFIGQVTAARHRLAQAGFTLAGIEARIRYQWIRQRTAGCIERPSQRPVSWTDRIDKVLTHRIWGTLIFLAVMFLVFESIFLIADPAKDIMDLGKNWLADIVNSLLNPGPLRSLLVEGVIGGVGAVIVFIPQIMILFAVIAFLEDCGYMARAAFLMDRLMSPAGLNGKSFIPLLSSMACAVPGIMSARVIENPRDRLATILVAPLMSCAARLPVYTLLIGAFFREYGALVQGLVFFCLYMIGIIAAPLMALLLRRTLLRGETPAFVMEMPLYKMPALKMIVRRSVDAGWMFLKRAGTFILASMILVWAALYFPSGDYEAQIAGLEDKIEDHRTKDEGDLTPAEKTEVEEVEKEISDKRSEWKKQSVLGRVGQAIEPVVEPLGWDWRIGMAALASFPAREVMVGTLGIIFGPGEGDLMKDDNYRLSMNQALHAQRWANEPERPLFTAPVALSVMVFFALCCQCVSTLVVIKRETNSWRWPIFTFVYMTALAYGGAFVTYHVANWF